MSMTPTPPTFAPAGRRVRGDEGTALVEFAFVMIFFITLVFGIIAFGVLLSFQQTLTQTANEGARAAAVTADDTVGTPLVDERIEAAKTAVQQYNSWGRTCSSPGFGAGTCEAGIVPHDCGGLTDTAALPDCITVTLTYDYEGHPLLPDFPFIGALLPDDIVGNATAQISDEG
jgi:Flp pilus assembly protein TadG